MMDATFDAEKVLHIVVNPELQHFPNLSAEVGVEYLLDSEVEDRGLQLEHFTRDPIDSLALPLSPRNQLQSSRLCRQRPDGEAGGCVINENPSLGLLHNAEKSRKRMLNHPPYRLGPVEHPRFHGALHLHRVVRARPGSLSVAL